MSANQKQSKPSHVVPKKSSNTKQTRSETVALNSCKFEIFGIVQGVYFRKHTQQQATSLGLRGYVMNTSRGTVVGVMEGEEEPIRKMKTWLSTVGSPKSRIEKADWKEEKQIKAYSYPNFDIRK